jgi:hypothetical protein
MKLLPLKLSRYQDLHHNARMDLVNEIDASTPKSSAQLGVALNIHDSILGNRVNFVFLSFKIDQ